MQDIKFGTDGIRAEVNKGLTPEIAYKVGMALALFLSDKLGTKKVLIAKDTRKSGDMLVCALCSGLMAYGVDVDFAGILPTPALAFLTRELGYNCGVMITASHNAHNYNGIKVFNENGGKFDAENCLKLEKLCDIKTNYAPFDKVGQLNKVEIERKYISFLKRNAVKVGFSLCIDCANGATSDIAKKIFCTCSNEVKMLSTSKQSELVNYKCGATDLNLLSEYVKEYNYSVGFAFDGDGDRIMAVDEKGEVVDGDELIFIIAKYLKERKRLSFNTVVGTVMTNYGVQASLNNIGIKLVREKVGDKYIQMNMQKNGYKLGGEQSGHIIIGDKSATGDGILTALMIIKIMNHEGKSLNELKSIIKKYPQKLTNVAVSEFNKDLIIHSESLREKVAKCEGELAGEGRILVRQSGTENLIRVLVEGENVKLINSISIEISSEINKLNS